MGDYRICSRCIMDTSSDPGLRLDDQGVCSYCHTYDEVVEANRYKKEGGEKALEQLFDKVKQECKTKEYDALLGISGGVDSSYVAYLAHKYGLRVLAVHVDAGWNSELAVSNVEKMCSKLGIDLHTVVVDWPSVRELQRAYMFSGLANQDVIQDHVIIAATNDMVKKFGVKYILNGSNYATEGILSKAYQYTKKDWRQIKAVHRIHGRGRDISKYPHFTFFDDYFGNQYLHHIKVLDPLNYIDYSKKEAIALLEREFGWQYYGGKHYESRFTKFFQETYLPAKFGWDKRRDHLSSLVVGGEMTREEALREIEISPGTPRQREEDRDYVLKKLEISMEEWEGILAAPNKTEDDYPNYKQLKKNMQAIKHFFIKSK